MTKFRLDNPCQNKESKQKKHDKETKEILMNVFSTRPFVLKRGGPRYKPLNSQSAQINFDITIWNGSYLAMHGQYIL